MAHTIVAVEGMPEGVQDFVRRLDRKSYGKGVVRVRPVTFFNIQYPKECREQILKDLGHTKTRAFKEHTYKNNKKAYKMKFLESPFKHGKFKMIPYWFFKMFGWIVGIKPSEPVEDTVEVKNPLNPRMVNIYVMADIEDNAWLVNARKGSKDDNDEVEYL